MQAVTQFAKKTQVPIISQLKNVYPIYWWFVHRQEDIKCIDIFVHRQEDIKYIKIYLSKNKSHEMLSKI